MSEARSGLALPLSTLADTRHTVGFMSLFTVGTAGILNGVYRMALVRLLFFSPRTRFSRLTSLPFLPLLPLRLARSLRPPAMTRPFSIMQGKKN